MRSHASGNLIVTSDQEGRYGKKRGLLRVKRAAWVHPVSNDTRLFINGLHGKKTSSDTFFRGRFLARTPSVTCNLFGNSLKKMKKLHAYFHTTCMMWADGRIWWIRWWADSMQQKRSSRRRERREKDTFPYKPVYRNIWDMRTVKKPLLIFANFYITAINDNNYLKNCLIRWLLH